jgi:phage baseplate assembly protein gpV
MPILPFLILLQLERELINFKTMAVIKYKDSNGNYQEVVGVTVKQYVKSPSYDSSSKRITFPAEAMFDYDATNKRITISGNS